MKRLLAIISFCLVFAAPALAQQAATTGPDSPATKDDVEAYMQVAHSHETMMNMMNAMLKPMHDMVHQEFLKDQDKLPPDFEAREDKQLDYMLQNFPFDELIQAMVPSYQKYFTRGDLQAITAFYSSPTGQKFLKEMPAIAADAMQAAMPIMTKYMDTVNARVQQDIQQSLNQTSPPAAKTPPATQN
jgi:hypothetical protein